jgi:hypothetical protein
VAVIVGGKLVSFGDNFTSFLPPPPFKTPEHAVHKTKGTNNLMFSGWIWL